MDTTLLIIVIVIPVLIIAMIVTIVLFQRYKHHQQNTENHNTPSPSPLQISNPNEVLTPPSYKHSPRLTLPPALEHSYMGDVSPTTVYHDFHSPS
jgi:hypothetical protein